ncbi:MAG: DUF370 domain-containing protein [Oscillospiraceae bacterium]|nr:DUF370 domain-containing protein [Oscillospiraceae bacterium]
MYLSIGADFSLRDRSVIGIFDLENASWSHHTKHFLAEAEKQGEVVTIAEESKSFILTEEYGMHRVYRTQFHSAALEKRAK